MRSTSQRSERADVRKIKTLRLRIPQDEVRGLIKIRSVYGSIAQLGEHLPYKQGVTGSSPVTSTIKYLYNLAW